MTAHTNLITRHTLHIYKVIFEAENNYIISRQYMAKEIVSPDIELVLAYGPLLASPWHRLFPHE
jgi:hypothetical protein